MSNDCQVSKISTIISCKSNTHMYNENIYEILWREKVGSLENWLARFFLFRERRTERRVSRNLLVFLKVFFFSWIVCCKWMYWLTLNYHYAFFFLCDSYTRMLYKIRDISCIINSDSCILICISWCINTTLKLYIYFLCWIRHCRSTCTVQQIRCNSY